MKYQIKDCGDNWAIQRKKKNGNWKTISYRKHLNGAMKELTKLSNKAMRENLLDVQD